MTLGEIGAVWQLHAERVRQIEVTALRKVRKAFKRMGIDATWLDALSLEVPESTFAQAMNRAASVASELELELPEDSPTSAGVVTVPRNGNGKSPVLALPRRLPAPTPSTPSTNVPRTDSLHLR